MKNAISASAVDSRQARGSAYPGAGEERIPMGQKPGDLDGLVIATSGRDRWCSGRAAEEELAGCGKTLFGHQIVLVSC